MKNKLYFPLFACALLGMTAACDSGDLDLEGQIPERFHKILYLDVYGKQQQALYDTNEANLYALSIIKGGSDPATGASAQVQVLTQDEVDAEYSDLEGVNYQVLPASSYTIDQPELIFAPGEEYKTVNVSIDPDMVKAAMENGDADAHWVLPLHVTSETDSINANRDELFLQVTEVITPTVGFSNTAINVKKYTYGRVSNITETVTLGLDTDNQWNIDLGLGIDQDYIDNYNSQNGTVFQLVPEGLYEFPASMQLASGTTNADMTINVDGSSLQPGDYMLPIEIANTSMFEISASNATYPMAFRIMGEELDRSNWSIYYYSTEEPTGEDNGNNGRAPHMIDGNTSTYWHTQWQGEGANPPLPHLLIFDTQSEHTFTQFALMQRENSFYTKGGKFYVTDDPESYKTDYEQDKNNVSSIWGEGIGSFNLAQENGAQTFGVKPTTGRYIVLLVTESYRSEGLACIAELYAYGLNN